MGFEQGPNAGAGSFVNASGAALGDVGGLVPAEGRVLPLGTLSDPTKLQRASLAQYILNNRRFNVRDFGARGTYTGGPFLYNDRPAIQLAIDTAAGMADVLGAPCVVEIPSGVYPISGATLLVDVGKVRFVGVGGAVVLLSDLTGAAAVQVYSSIAAAEQATNSVGGFEGVEIRGLSLASSIGLLVGNVSFGAAGSQVLIYRCAVRRFAKNITFTNNAYRIQFLHVGSFDALASGQHIDYPAGLSNSGECITWEHCMIANSQGAVSDGTMAEVLLQGVGLQMDFYGCSLLNVRLRTTAECDVNWSGGNIENPGASFAYRMIDVGTSGRVNLIKARLVLNDFGSSNTLAPFTVASDARGLVLDALKYPGGAFLNFGGSTIVRQLVDGTGPVMARDCVPFGAPSGWAGQQFPIIAASASRSRNGDFESGALAPWVGGPYGTGGAVVINGTAALRGTFGAQVTLTGGGAGGVEYTQTVPVRPLEFVAAHITYRIFSGAALAVAQVRFLDASGATISTLSTGTGASTSRAELVAVGFVPVGAVSAVLVWNVQTPSGAGVAYIDDVLFNIG